MNLCTKWDTSTSQIVLRFLYRMHGNDKCVNVLSFLLIRAPFGCPWHCFVLCLPLWVSIVSTHPPIFILWSHNWIFECTICQKTKKKKAETVTRILPIWQSTNACPWLPISNFRCSTRRKGGEKGNTRGKKKAKLMLTICHSILVPWAHEQKPGRHQNLSVVHREPRAVGFVYAGQEQKQPRSKNKKREKEIQAHNHQVAPHLITAPLYHDLVCICCYCCHYRS